MAQQVSVQDLDLAQLSDVRKQLDDELKHLTNSFAQLNQALGKFKSCLENVKDIEKGSKDKQILVPLTNSLYVPGKLANLKTVIIDIGTGYYVEKTTPEATTYYNTKVNLVQANLNAVQEIIQRKQDNLNVVVSVMQAKVQQQGAEGGSS